MSDPLGGVPWLEQRYPRLVERIRKEIEASERRFETRGEKQGESFLWEHTRQVAAITHRLCRRDGLDPLIPVLCAVYHDAAKFSGGSYHDGDCPEEEGAALLAEKGLRAADIPVDVIRETCEALRALYRENTTRHSAADIVHDADFLVKSGRLGVSAFFSKAALRGRPPLVALTESLSRELTYAAALPANMRTAGARDLAERSARQTSAYYRGLIRELREYGIARFRIKKIEFPFPDDPRKTLTLHLILQEKCPQCGGSPELRLRTDSGIKCTRLLAESICPECGKQILIGFCLPEISG